MTKMTLTELDLCHSLIISFMPEINRINTQSAGLYKTKKNQKSIIIVFPPYFFLCLVKYEFKPLKRERHFVIQRKPKTIFLTKTEENFAYSNKQESTLLCRLRVGRSFLKSHSFSINMSSTDRGLGVQGALGSKGPWGPRGLGVQGRYEHAHGFNGYF